MAAKMAMLNLETAFPSRVVVDGREFHYVVEGSGTPLVFLHGVLGDYRTWAPQWSDFVPRYRCISYSRRHNWPNKNTKADPDHSALTEAKDLAGLLDAWAIKSAIFVASSYGAFTALAFALAQPHRVRALVLAEPPMLKWANFTSDGPAIRETFQREVRNPAREAFMRGDDTRGVMLLSRGIVGEQAATTMAQSAIERRLASAASIRALTLSTDEFPMLERDRVSALNVPTLLIAGEHTPPIHEVVYRALCAAMPRAQQLRVPKAGHGVARDNPSYFNKHTLEFLDWYVA